MLVPRLHDPRLPWELSSATQFILVPQSSIWPSAFLAPLPPAAPSTSGSTDQSMTTPSTSSSTSATSSTSDEQLGSEALLALAQAQNAQQAAGAPPAFAFPAPLAVAAPPSLLPQDSSPRADFALLGPLPMSEGGSKPAGANKRKAAPQTTEQRRQRHKEVEIRRRKKISTLFQQLSEELDMVGYDKASLIAAAVKRLAEYKKRDARRPAPTASSINQANAAAAAAEAESKMEKSSEDLRSDESAPLPLLQVVPSPHSQPQPQM